MADTGSIPAEAEEPLRIGVGAEAAGVETFRVNSANVQLFDRRRGEVGKKAVTAARPDEALKRGLGESLRHLGPDLKSCRADAWPKRARFHLGPAADRLHGPGKNSGQQASPPRVDGHNARGACQKHREAIGGSHRHDVPPRRAPQTVCRFVDSTPSTDVGAVNLPAKPHGSLGKARVGERRCKVRGGRHVDSAPTRGETVGNPQRLESGAVKRKPARSVASLCQLSGDQPRGLHPAAPVIRRNRSL